MIIKQTSKILSVLKILSLLLTLCLLLGMMPISAAADINILLDDYDNSLVSTNVVITFFDALPDETLWQDYVYGEVSSQSALNLPDTLIVMDTEKNPITITDVTWQSEETFDPELSQMYEFTAVLPEGYILADGVTSPVISVFIRPEDIINIQLLAAAGSNMSIGGETDVDISTNQSGTGWSWVAATDTLTLGTGYTGDGIVIRCNPSDHITLILTDDISITTTGIHFPLNIDSGSLTIQAGSHTLNVRSDLCYGIDVGGDLIIESGTVVTFSEDSHGISTRTGSTTITGSASVTTTGYDDFIWGGSGIQSYSDIVINTSGVVNASGKFGLNSVNGNITISGGTVNANGIIDAAALLASGDDVIITGGTVSTNTTTTASGDVRGNLTVSGSNALVTINGDVIQNYYSRGGNLTVSTGTVIVTGTVVDSITVTGGAVTVNGAPVIPTPVAVTWSGLTANGAVNTTSTSELTLTFDVEPTNLAIEDIAVTGATKGTLTGTGMVRILTISNITVNDGENVTLAITNPSGYSISPSSRDVAVHKATSVDTTAPTPGGSGAITTANITQNTLTLNWSKAIDNKTAQEALKYYVYRSNSANINTIANCTSNGTLLNVGGSTDIVAFNVTGLATNTVYYFNVVVEDATGNKATYTMKSQTTAMPPAATSGGTSSNTTDSSKPITIDKKIDLPVIASQEVKAAVDKNGKATITISESQVKTLIDKAKTGNTKDGIGLTISTTFGTDVKSAAITMDQKALALLVSSGIERFEISTPLVGFLYDKAAISEMNKQATGALTISIAPVTKLSDAAKALIGSRPVYNLTVNYQQNGRIVNITNFGKGTGSIAIAYNATSTEKTGSLFGVYVDENSKPHLLTNSSYDNGRVIFSRSTLSTYGVGYKASTSFTDTANHWAKDSIDFVVSRSLISGTSSTTFAPNTAITRADFIMSLGKLSGADVSGYTQSSFTDVEDTNSAMPYIEWAVVNKIVEGVGDNKFLPTADITREQMAVMMVHYAKVAGYTLPISRQYNYFVDEATISSWAEKMVKTIAQANIIVGKDGNKFDPQASATRAEASTILRRFVESVINEGTARGWVKNNSGQWQHYNWKGEGTIGWLNITADEIYYLDTNGIMIAGKWLQVGSKWYYFYADGKLAQNATIDGYSVGEDGARKE